MKFKINRDHFTTGLQQVLNIVGTRSTMPILSNVLIEARDATVTLTTTNLDIGIRAKIQAEVIRPGAITLPVRKLAMIVKELPSLDVEVDATSQQAKIFSGNAIFRIMGMNAEEFPPLATFDDKRSFVLPQLDLLSMLRCVSYAQSTDDSRYIMNGVYFNFEVGKLTLVATDGRRLAIISKELAVSEDNTGSITLPARTVEQVERLLGQGETVRIAFNERQVAFEIATSTGAPEGLVDSIYLVSKVVDGVYPNYRQVIPRDSHLHIKLNRESFANCVRRAAIVASDKNHSVRLKIANNKVEVTSSSSDVGDSSDSIAVEYSGPEVQVAFNPQFLLDPLKALTRDEIILEFKDELNPGVFRTPDSFLCVIMPLRLN